MPRYKNGCIGKKRRKQRDTHCSLEESKMGKKTHARYVQMLQVSSPCPTPSQLPLRSIPSPRRMAPPKKRTIREIETFKAPRKKARRVNQDMQDSLNQAFTAVLERHGIASEDPGLFPICMTLDANLAGGSTVKVVSVNDEGAEGRPASITSPLPHDEMEMQTNLLKLVKVMDTHDISSTKLNKVRQIYRDLPSSDQVKEAIKDLNEQVKTTIGVHGGPGWASIDVTKAVTFLIR